jgi:hypothetical protein
MLRRRQEVTALLVDAAGLAISCGLLAFAGFGWLVALLLVLRKWIKYGSARLRGDARTISNT